MDVTITLTEQKVGLICTALDALNKAGGVSLENSAMLINLSNELQLSCAPKPAVAPQPAPPLEPAKGKK